MEAGDSLLGVTMQPGGSSKVVVETGLRQRLTARRRSVARSLDRLSSCDPTVVDRDVESRIVS